MNFEIREQAGVAAAISAFLDSYEIPSYSLPARTGEKREDEKMFRALFKSGQELVLCGNIGMAGTVLLEALKREDLKKNFSAHFINTVEALKPQLEVWPEQRALEGCGVVWAAPVFEGGLLAALNRLAKDSPLGFRVDYDQVPTKQLTVEFCEIFDFNPWKLLSGGCTLLVTAHGYKTVSALENLGVPCRTIGHMEDNKDKLICHGEIRSCLNRPEQDEIYRLVKD